MPNTLNIPGSSALQFFLELTQVQVGWGAVQLRFPSFSFPLPLSGGANNGDGGIVKTNEYTVSKQHLPSDRLHSSDREQHINQSDIELLFYAFPYKKVE